MIYGNRASDKVKAKSKATEAEFEAKYEEIGKEEVQVQVKEVKQCLAE